MVSRSNHCAPPEVQLSVRATASITAVPEAWTLRIQQAQAAPAHAALNTPAPSANDADADSQDYTDTRVRLAKARDCLIVDARYEIAFSIIGGCPPFQTALVTTGEVVSAQPNLPRQGTSVLSRSKIFTGDAFPARSHATLQATVSVTDCAGNTASCSTAIPEP